MLSPNINKRKTNVTVMVILILPFMYSVISVLVCNITNESLFFAYGYELKSLTKQASIICIKKFLTNLVHTKFPSLVFVLLCYLCLHFSSCFNCLTQRVFNYSPEKFGPSQQVDILRQKAKIDDIFENLQDVFSQPSVFVTITHLLTCCSLLGMSMVGGSFSKTNAVKAVFYSVPNFVSLIALLWIAGGLTEEQNKLKSAFDKRAHSRFLIIFPSEEQQCKREILDRTAFVLNGGNTFSYTRNSILALFGTLLTYSLLIYKS
ncbi:uncharacterized protein TNCT_165171 [Trichonephila clavata]|uniref:Uncharacterized protein n=1 Tax=Trichonephila clavata TaxID=2740835 RepID=A0A8X6HDF2_TRICU|nr:uncharacterized protein TNCT_165171 [Trichonephila clavata]